MAGTTNYPTTVDSHTGGDPFGFQVLANNLSTVLTATAGAADTTLTVNSTTGFESRGIITIENEVITYTGKTATTFTGCSRGAGGTTAAAHVSGKTVGLIYTAAHHNDLAAAIVALETKVGIGSSGIAQDKLAAVDHVLAYRSSGTLTLTTATETTVTFDAEQRDSNTMHDNSSNTSRLTCKTAGLYVIHGQVTFTSNAAVAQESYIRLNGSTRIAVGSSTGAASQYVPVYREYVLAVNDYVELRAYQNGGGNVDVVNGALYTYFGMRRVST